MYLLLLHQIFFFLFYLTLYYRMHNLWDIVHCELLHVWLPKFCSHYTASINTLACIWNWASRTQQNAPVRYPQSLCLASRKQMGWLALQDSRGSIVATVVVFDELCTQRTRTSGLIMWHLHLSPWSKASQCHTQNKTHNHTHFHCQLNTSKCVLNPVNEECYSWWLGEGDVGGMGCAGVVGASAYWSSFSVTLN